MVYSRQYCISTYLHDSAEAGKEEMTSICKDSSVETPNSISGYDQIVDKESVCEEFVHALVDSCRGLADLIESRPEKTCWSLTLRHGCHDSGRIR